MGSKIIVEIIHKSHPFCGRKGVLIKVGRGKDPRVKVRLRGGSELEMKRSWTDLPTDDISEVSEHPEHLLEASSLLEMVKRIKEIKGRNNDAEQIVSRQTRRSKRIK
jgi:hypothetical protein